VLGLSSESDFAFARDRCAGTPVGRISFGLSLSGETGVSAAIAVITRVIKTSQAENQRFMGRKLAIKIRSAQGHGLQILPALNQFDLVTFRRVDKCDHAAAGSLVRAIGKWITFRGRFPREFFEIVHLKREMSQVRANHHWTAFIEFTELDLFFALRGFKKNQLRSAARSMPSRFLKAEHLLIKTNRLLQVFYPIAGV
jgi:hypothetical protein